MNKRYKQILDGLDRHTYKEIDVRINNPNMDTIVVAQILDAKIVEFVERAYREIIIEGDKVKKEYEDDILKFSAVIVEALLKTKRLKVEIEELAQDIETIKPNISN